MEKKRKNEKSRQKITRNSEDFTRAYLTTKQCKKEANTKPDLIQQLKEKSQLKQLSKWRRSFKTDQLHTRKQMRGKKATSRSCVRKGHFKKMQIEMNTTLHGKGHQPIRKCGQRQALKIKDFNRTTSKC